jgi:four helix bundle protein
MTEKNEITYQEWEETAPEVFKKDSLWQMKAHKYALFLGHLAWYDVTKLVNDGRTRKLADQLYDSVGSVPANLSEGYSRGTGRDRARFYEYSLGSARESMDRYYSGRHVIGETIVEHRYLVLNEIIRLLLVMVPQQRGRALREDPVPYQTSAAFEEIPQPY